MADRRRTTELKRRLKVLLRPLLLLAVLVGLALGIGGYTFVYAKGASYLTDRPEACANCHVMNTVFEGWLKGGHQHAAVCNDCHVPHDFAGKWFTKADNGFHHSFAFTFEEIPLVIHAKERSQAVVQANCMRCHAGKAAHAIGGSSGNEEPLRCVACHREVGHPH